MVQKSGKLTSWGNGSLSHYLSKVYISQVVVWDFWTINSPTPGAPVVEKSLREILNNKWRGIRSQWGIFNFQKPQKITYFFSQPFLVTHASISFSFMIWPWEIFTRGPNLQDVWGMTLLKRIYGFTEKHAALWELYGRNDLFLPKGSTKIADSPKKEIMLNMIVHANHGLRMFAGNDNKFWGRQISFTSWFFWHIPPWEKEHHLEKCLGRGYSTRAQESFADLRLLKERQPERRLSERHERDGNRSLDKKDRMDRSPGKGTK